MGPASATPTGSPACREGPGLGPAFPDRLRLRRLLWISVSVAAGATPNYRRFRQA